MQSDELNAATRACKLYYTTKSGRILGERLSMHALWAGEGLLWCADCDELLKLIWRTQIFDGLVYKLLKSWKPDNAFVVVCLHIPNID